MRTKEEIEAEIERLEKCLNDPHGTTQLILEKPEQLKTMIALWTGKVEALKWVLTNN